MSSHLHDRSQHEWTKVHHFTNNARRLFRFSTCRPPKNLRCLLNRYLRKRTYRSACVDQTVRMKLHYSSIQYTATTKHNLRASITVRAMAETKQKDGMTKGYLTYNVMASYELRAMRSKGSRSTSQVLGVPGLLSLGRSCYISWMSRKQFN